MAAEIAKETPYMRTRRELFAARSEIELHRLWLHDSYARAPDATFTSDPTEDGDFITLALYRATGAAGGYVIARSFTLVPGTRGDKVAKQTWSSIEYLDAMAATYREAVERGSNDPITWAVLTGLERFSLARNAAFDALRGGA